MPRLTYSVSHFYNCNETPEVLAARMKSIFKGIQQAQHARVAGPAHELFKLFLEFRMGGMTQQWARGSAAPLATNACEGNADVVFYRDGFRFSLSTSQDNENVLALDIVYDFTNQYSSEDI